MKINKTLAIALSVLFIFSMTASIILVPSAKAATTAPTFHPYAYINVAPNPVGVNQQVSIDMWLSIVLPGAQFGNDVRWQNYGLAITAPNGAVTTENWTVVNDPTANQDYQFTPSQTGTYTLTFSFPGQTYTWAPFFGAFGPVDATGNVYAPCSATTTLTVQTAQLSTIPTTPLPTAFWTRPIYGENSNWYTISSNWLGTGSPGYSSGMMGATFQANDVGSITGHIMWTKPLQSGGVVGGNNFVTAGDTYADGSAYAIRYSNPIIVDGMLIYTEPLSFAGDASGPTICVNLLTGQQIWSSSTMPALSFAYVYDMQDANEHGVWPPILVATVGGSFLGPPVPLEWVCFDADTGTPTFDVSGVPPGTAVMGPEGEYLQISLVNYGNATNPNWYMQEWNSSRLWGNNYNGPSTTPPVVPPISNGAVACTAAGVPTGQPVTADWAGGYVESGMGPEYVPSLFDWNVSVASLNTLTSTPSIEAAFLDNMVLLESGAMPSAGDSVFGSPSWSPYTYIGLNLNPANGQIGSQLWSNTVTPPAGNLTISYDGALPTANNGAGVFIEYRTETMQYVGYSMTTGKQIWGPTTSQTALNFFSTGWTGQGPTLAYDNVYTGGMSGIVYCYSLTTGDLVWTYGNGGEGNSTSAGLNWATNYPTYISAIANGIVYTITGEHTFETPIYKGALTRAINATTGAEIWTLSSATAGSTSYALADGYNTWCNAYDNQIYVVGRGPSQTTANVQAFGNNVVISGTVMDISAGTKQTQQAADFPAGVPCASDASMSAWMSYVYQQQAEPTNFTGVPVVVSVTDSNHNTYVIGTATTDSSGSYSLTWAPDVPGNFTVQATFAGNNGYYGSSAETFFYAPPASATPAPTTAPVSGFATTSDLATYMAAGVIAIIIAIAIVGLLILRRKP